MRVATAEDRTDPVRAVRRYGLLYLIKRAYSASKDALDRMAREHGLTVADFTMLSFLRRMEPCSSADLARAQRITPQAATQQVAQLRAKGMIASVESAANRRIALISMTPLGREAVAAIGAEVRAMEAAMLADMTDAERDAVLRFLMRAADQGNDERNEDQ